MVGIVVVSHSAALADGVVELAREMGGEELALVAAGGTEDGGLGTDAERVRAAIAGAMSPDGVLVLMDLGSALMSAELAVELLEEASGPVTLSAAPLVEGTVAAAVAARGGAELDDVAAQARGALAMKTAQLGDEGEAMPAAAPQSSPPDAEARIVLANPLGLHARPAAQLVAAARGFEAGVELARGDGPPAPADSLTAVLGLAVRRGDELRVLARGRQAPAAVAALRALAEAGFGEIGESAAPSPLGVRPGAELRGPPVEAPAAGAVLHGLPAAAGIARGPASLLSAAAAGVDLDRRAGPVEEERARLDGALAAAAEAIAADRAAVAERGGESAAAIFDAHGALLADPALLHPARTAIADGRSAEAAIDAAARAVEERYRGFPDPLLRERAADVRDVARRVLAALGGAAALAPEGIVIADELTPGGAAALDPDRVRGVATARGTPTAHGAILARALGLPAVVGLGPALLAVPAGTELLLDGDAGTVRVDPPAEALAAARAAGERMGRRRAEARRHADEPARTRDGETIEVRANVASAAEAARAVELGADGVGLLRTEFLYLDRPELPGEDEQADILRAIARALGGRPLVVRTLDAGADKPLPALPMEPEANPFLGLRGIRLTLQRPELLATQLRALLRVAAEHPVSAMLPMVATVAELDAARELLEQARAQTGIDAPMALGIMVEVPAAALGARRLAARADFFSIGTNDLTQYTMAAERGDARLGALLSGPQPAVLALVAAAVRGAQAHRRPVAVCGELAGDPAAALLLAGLGVDELSVAPALVAEVKAALREVEMSRLREVAAAALEAPDGAAARALAAALL